MMADTGFRVQGSRLRESSEKNAERVVWTRDLCRWIAVAVICCLFFGARAGFAQDSSGGSMKVRLIEACPGNSAEQSSAGLGDVLPVLRRNRPAETYVLVGSGSCQLVPGSRAATSLPRGFRVTANAAADEPLSVEVYCKGNRVVNARVRLSPAKPVILGGLPAPGDKTHIIVLTLVPGQDDD